MAPPAPQKHGVALKGTERPNRTAIYRHWRKENEDLMVTIDPSVCFLSFSSLFSLGDAVEDAGVSIRLFEADMAVGLDHNDARNVRTLRLPLRQKQMSRLAPTRPKDWYLWPLPMDDLRRCSNSSHQLWRWSCWIVREAWCQRWKRWCWIVVSESSRMANHRSCFDLQRLLYSLHL